MFAAYPTIFATEDAPPGPLTVTPPPGQGTVGESSFQDFFGTVHQVAGAASEVGETWGEIRGLREVQEVEPQPTEASMGGPAPSDPGLGVLGITVTGILLAVGVGVGIYLLGGNVAWAIVGGITAAVLSTWVMG